MTFKWKQLFITTFTSLSFLLTPCTTFAFDESDYTEPTDWSFTEPKPAANRLIETRIVYKYRDKQFEVLSSNLTPSGSGWTLDGTETYFGQPKYVLKHYDQCQGGYTYDGFSYEDPSLKAGSTTHLSKGYNYDASLEKTFEGVPISWQSYPYSGFWTWEGTVRRNGDYTYIGNNFQKGYFGNVSKLVQEYCGKGKKKITGTNVTNYVTYKYPWKDAGSIIFNKPMDSSYWFDTWEYRIYTRSVEQANRWWKWGDWSDWLETKYTHSSTREVESKVQYRYRDFIDKYPPTIEACTIENLTNTQFDIVCTGVRDEHSGINRVEFVTTLKSTHVGNNLVTKTLLGTKVNDTTWKTTIKQSDFPSNDGKGFYRVVIDAYDNSSNYNKTVVSKVVEQPLGWEYGLTLTLPTGANVSNAKGIAIKADGNTSKLFYSGYHYLTGVPATTLNQYYIQVETLQNGSWVPYMTTSDNKSKYQYFEKEFTINNLPNGQYRFKHCAEGWGLSHCFTLTSEGLNTEWLTIGDRNNLKIANLKTNASNHVILTIADSSVRAEGHGATLTDTTVQLKTAVTIGKNETIKNQLTQSAIAPRTLRLISKTNFNSYATVTSFSQWSSWGTIFNLSQTMLGNLPEGHYYLEAEVGLTSTQASTLSIGKSYLAYSDSNFPETFFIGNKMYDFESDTNGYLILVISSSNTPPTATITVAPSRLHNGNITATFTARPAHSSLPITSMKYRLSGAQSTDGKWIEISNGGDITISSNGDTYIELQVVDSRNLVGVATDSVTVDKNPPLIQVETSNPLATSSNSVWINDKRLDVEITLSDNETHISEGSYTLSNVGTQTIYQDVANLTLTEEGVHTLKVDAKDKVKNPATLTKVFQMDSTPPTITITTNPTFSTHQSFVNQEVEVTVKVEDNLSQVSSSCYRLRGATNSNQCISFVGSATFTLSDNGTTYVEVEAIDKAQNSTSKVSPPINISLAKPELTIFGNSEWTNATSVPLTLGVSVGTFVELEYAEYRLTGATERDWTPFVNNDVVSIFNEGITYIETRAKDSAKNEATASKVVRIDRQKPTCFIETDSAWTNDLSRQAVITVEDTGGSGLLSSYYRTTQTSDGTYHSFSETVSLLVEQEGTTYIDANVIDKAGNHASCETKTVNLDWSPPVIELVHDGTDKWQNKPITITATAKDSGSGIRYLTAPDGREEMDTHTKSATTTYVIRKPDYYYFIAVDWVGNVSSDFIYVRYIDLDIPGLLIRNPLHNIWSRPNVSVHLEAIDLQN